MIRTWLGALKASITISKRVIMLCIIGSIVLLAIGVPLNVRLCRVSTGNTDENSKTQQNSTCKDGFSGELPPNIPFA